jgi:uncharacterized protein
MEEEVKIRGPPVGEVPKSPLLRRKAKVEEKPAEILKEEHHVEEVQRKVAVITGASSGIGKAVTLHLAASNYDLVLVARKKEPLQQLQQELAKFAVKTIVRECDVTKVAQVHDTIHHAIKAFGRIDVLVNSAGLGIYGSFEEMKLEDINTQMVTNYFGTVLFIKEALPKLKESKGVIVNVASTAGLIGVPQMAAYSASKHAVLGLSESLRFELHDHGVSVSCVCPGKVDTNFFANKSFEDVKYATEKKAMPPSAVAKLVDKAIRERKFLYVTPAHQRILLLLRQLFPESFTRTTLRKEMRQA